MSQGNTEQSPFDLLAVYRDTTDDPDPTSLTTPTKDDVLSKPGVDILDAIRKGDGNHAPIQAIKIIPTKELA